MISFVSSLRIMIVINQTIDDRKSGSMMVQIFSTLPLGELKRLYVDHASTIVDIKCCFANYQATRELEKSEIPSVGRWTSLHLATNSKRSMLEISFPNGVGKCNPVLNLKKILLSRGNRVEQRRGCAR